MHWGQDPVLEKHYVPARSQRARSVLTFFAQDTGTHNLVYANADLSKASQNREAIAFCDHWKPVSGHDPKMLIMDQKVTTQAVLGELDDPRRQVRHPAMRSATLDQDSQTPWPASDYKTVPWTGPAAQPAAQSPRGPRREAGRPTPAPSASSSSPAWAATRPPSSSPTDPHITHQGS